MYIDISEELFFTQVKSYQINHMNYSLSSSRETNNAVSKLDTEFKNSKNA